MEQNLQRQNDSSSGDREYLSRYVLSIYVILVDAWTRVGRGGGGVLTTQQIDIVIHRATKLAWQKNRLIITCFLYDPVLFLHSPGLSDRANREEAPPHIWFLRHGRVLQPTHSVPQFPGKPPFLLLTDLILHIMSVEGCLKAQRCSVLQPTYTVNKNTILS